MPRPKRRKPLTNEEQEALFCAWDRIMVSEGMPTEPKKALMRDGTKGPDGVRRWRGPREMPSELMDVLGFDQRLLTATEKLMQEPLKPIGGYTAEQLETLRETLLEAVETILTPREAEAMISIVLGGETYNAVSERMGLPRSTCYLTVTRALDKLRDDLQDKPEVVDYLNRHTREETE